MRDWTGEGGGTGEDGDGVERGRGNAVENKSCVGQGEEVPEEMKVCIL